MTTLNIDSGEFFQRLDQSRADNSVGLRPRDVSYLIRYLNSYIGCNLQRSISAKRK